MMMPAVDELSSLSGVLPVAAPWAGSGADVGETGAAGWLVSGDVVGGPTGALLGEAEGAVGSDEAGAADGMPAAYGERDGASEGAPDGVRCGEVEGGDGDVLGSCDGCCEAGAPDGGADGVWMGPRLGSYVCPTYVGDADGTDDGDPVGPTYLHGMYRSIGSSILFCRALSHVFAPAPPPTVKQYHP